MTNCTSSILKRLADKKVIVQYKYEVMRDAIGELGERQDPDDIILNDEQSAAYEGIMGLIKAEKPAGALLYGKRQDVCGHKAYKKCNGYG